MAVDTTEIEVGAADLTFGSVAGPVGEVLDLGGTIGGVRVGIETQSQEITVDQYGTTPVFMVILGRRGSATAPLAQTGLVQLEQLIPGSDYSAVNEELTVLSGTGDDLRDYADELVITSRTNSNFWIKFYKAIPIVSAQAEFVPNGVTVWPVTFTALIIGTNSLSVDPEAIALIHRVTT
jgi:hypothetical protein